MKRTYFYTVVVLGCALLLAGCAEPQIPSEDTPAPTPTASPVTAAPEATAEPAVTAAPTLEPSTSDSSEQIDPQEESVQEYSDLSFLSEEQRQLYMNAYDARFGLYGMGDNLMRLWNYKIVTDGSDSVPFVEDHYTLYDVSFNEFSEKIHRIFTDSCLASTDYAIKFMDYDGKVAVHFSLSDDLVGGTTVYALEQYPDTYRSGASTEEKVEFTLISHYDRNGLVETPLEIYTVEYPIRMVNTPDGWRIDEFHTTMYG